MAEEAQAIGVDIVGNAVGVENLPDVGEVVEGGFGLDEAGLDDEIGGIVDGLGEDLQYFPGPPAVRGAAILEELPIGLALPSAAGFVAAFDRFRQQRGHVFKTWMRTLETERLKANRRKSS